MKKGKSDWRDGFLFVGNQLTLDFLNTCPVQEGEPSELLPDFSALLHWFQTAGLLSREEIESIQQKWGKTAKAKEITAAMREFRELLRGEILAWENGGAIRGSTITELNRLMAEHPMCMRLKTGRRTPSTELWFDSHEPEDLFAPLAHNAATLFANVDRRGVRKCPTCVLHFYDTSKKGTRRWCSMRMCGNRRKVAAYATRQRIQDRRTPKGS